MSNGLAPIVFDDHDRAAAENQRPSPVAKAPVSAVARRKLLARSAGLSIARLGEASGSRQAMALDAQLDVRAERSDKWRLGKVASGRVN